MGKKYLISSLALLIAAVSVPCLAQDRVTLINKAKTGKFARYKAEGQLKLENSGTKVDLDLRETEKVSFTDVAASGNITMERQTESIEVNVNGQKSSDPGDETKKKTIMAIRPDGSLVSYKEDGADKSDAQINVRLYVSSNPIFAGKPVAVGDKWSHEFSADDDLGIRAAKANYAVLGYEQKDGVDAVKIKMDFQETAGDRPMSASGTLWVEKSSGDVVSSDLDYQNIPFGDAGGGTSVNGTIHSERIEGSPLDDVKSGAKPGAKPDAKPDTKPEPKKEKAIDDTVKDYEKLPGLFTLYRKHEAGRDTIYLEIKEEQLDQPMLLEATASTGDSSKVVAGDPLKDMVFEFSKLDDDKILMVTPNYNFRANSKSPIARAVRRSFADAYLEQFKIEAKQPERKSLLIDVSDLFKGDIAEISSQFQGGGLAALFGGGGGSYGMDREKTYISKLKSFPENLSVETSYHFVRGGGGGGLAALLGGQTLADARSIPLKVNYTVFSLGNSDYRPRLADPRIGYFQTEYQNFDTDAQDDLNVRYIQRWQLEKADPKAAVSLPKKPIVFWLDNAIPLEYRDAVREGILMWNKAFLKIGIQDAIVVKQMPDDADWDHADMRYNVIRWVTSPGSAYAVAQARTNPITGQVINADITVDFNWTHAMKSERRSVIAPSSYFHAAAAPTAQDIDPRRCEMLSTGGMDQAWAGEMAMNMLAPLGAKLDEKAFVHSWLREIVCHEMGHILGLRHNFIASTYHSLEDLKNEGVVADSGIAASVMDYTPWNISALESPGVDYFQSTIGPYDIWAIQYGYTHIDAATPETELPALRQIASECNEPGHAYQSDEAADQFDPAVTRYDLSSDPLAYWTRSLKVSSELLTRLGDREPKQGESYWEFTRDFNRLLNLYTQSAAETSRYIGGLHVNRNHRGDPGERPTLVPVSGSEQRQALGLLNTYIFSAGAFKIPSSYYTHMTANPNQGFIEALFGGPQDFPIRDELASIQHAALDYVFSADVLDRVANNEFKLSDPKMALTLPFLFHSVSATVWSELDTKADINALHRQLQRSYLDAMIDMVVKTNSPAPEDARMLAWDQLRQLRSRIARVQSAPHDEYTRIHLDECQVRIARALNAQQTVGAETGSGNGGLGGLLGGATAAQH